MNESLMDKVHAFGAFNQDKKSMKAAKSLLDTLGKDRIVWKELLDKDEKTYGKPYDNANDLYETVVKKVTDARRNGENLNKEDIREWIRTYDQVKESMPTTAVDKKQEDKEYSQTRMLFENLGESITKGFHTKVNQLGESLEKGAQVTGEHSASAIKIGLAGLLGPASPLVSMVSDLVDVGHITSIGLTKLGSSIGWGIKKIVGAPFKVISHIASHFTTATPAARNEKEYKEEQHEKKKISLLERILGALTPKSTGTRDKIESVETLNPITKGFRADLATFRKLIGTTHGHVKKFAGSKVGSHIIGGILGTYLPGSSSGDILGSLIAEFAPGITKKVGTHVHGKIAPHISKFADLTPAKVGKRIGNLAARIPFKTWKIPGIQHHRQEERREGRQEEHKKISLLERILGALTPQSTATSGRNPLATLGKWLFSPVGLLVGGIALFAKKIITVLDKIKNWLLKDGLYVLAGIGKSLIGGAFGLVKKVGKWLLKDGFKIIAQLGKDLLTGAWSLIKNVGGKLIKLIIDGIESITGGIAEGVGSILAAPELLIGGAIAAAIVGLGYLAYKYRAKIKEMALDIWHHITEGVAHMWKWVKDGILGFAHHAKERTATITSSATHTASSIAGEIAKGAAYAVTGSSYTANKWSQGARGAVSHAGNSLLKWQLGSTSAMYESGGEGAGAISSGTGDYGQASYGMFQLSSKGGNNSSVMRFLNSAGYAPDFAGLTPGTRAFNIKWKTLATNDPNFSNAQYAYADNTYYKPQMQLLKNEGIDLTHRGAAVQNAIWSNAVQFGPGSRVIEQSLKGHNVAKMSDADIIKSIYAYKKANVGALFHSSSKAIQTSVATRFNAEEGQLLALNKQPVQSYEYAPPTREVATTSAPIITREKSAGMGSVVINASTIPSIVSDEGLLILNTYGLMG